MSIELVTMIVSVASTLLGLAAGFGWVISRTDARFERFEQRMEAQFDRVEAQFDRVDAQFERLEAEVKEVRSELGDVKIAIARLEGPPPRLLSAR